MKIDKIVVGELRTNCYLLTKNLETLIIDPGDESEKIINFIKENGYNVVGILVTHHHYDHIGALKDLETYFNLKVNEIPVNFDIEVIETKGHTDDSVSFYLAKEKIAFVGDFIFKGTIGTLEFGGNVSDMKASIDAFLKEISDEVIIYPGHGKETTFGDERKNLEDIINRLDVP